MENNLPAIKKNEFFNPKVGLRALFSDPHWLAPYQQTTKIWPTWWDIVGGDGAQGDDNGGGRRHIISAIEIGGKQINKTKFSKALCGRKSTNKHNIYSNACGSVEGGIWQKTRPAGNAGVPYSIVLGAVELGGGRNKIK